jgi:hypothetical protein
MAMRAVAETKPYRSRAKGVKPAATALREQADQRRINLLNIGLMLLACALAYVLPFELFLFSYAVLGPLHYLTEISWLHKRNYFLQGKRDYWLLAGLCVLVFIFAGVYPHLGMWNPTLICIAFGSALAMVACRKPAHKIALIAAVSLAALLLRHQPGYRILFYFFLPTIIHVYVFTGLFILYGALKSRSRSGSASFLVLLACGGLIFLYTPELTSFGQSDYVRNSYRSFELVNFYLAKLFGFADVQQVADIYTAPSGIVLMRLLAFAYTYHYLNWFSKTSVIKWHESAKPRLALILGLWLLSVGLYAVDYNLGLLALLFLSMLHVLLEFPLNHHTILGIPKELRAMAR